MTKKPTRLNPFENQVYFHLYDFGEVFAGKKSGVLIPLRIRSISTQREHII